MYVIPAKKEHLPNIQALQDIYGLMSIEDHHLSRRDVALVALDGNRVVGFVWAGLMAKNKVAYVDKVVVHPDYKNKKVALELYSELTRKLIKRGVKEVFGFIKQDKYHDQSLFNALRFTFKTDGVPYTMVHTNADSVLSELEI